MMIQNGRQACFKKDKKGYLPAHVACSRHCSPEKLLMLLEAHPGSLTSKTNDGQTLLTLAVSTATKSHPNYALIDELKRALVDAGQLQLLQHGDRHLDSFPTRVSSDDTNDNDVAIGSPTSKQNTASTSHTPRTRSRKRKVTVDEDDPADLLMHFSRHQIDTTDIKRIAKV
jgi:hypothetical protein